MTNNSNDRIIELLERELEKSNKQNEKLSKQIQSLSEQVRELTRALFGSKSEKSKYIDPNQPSLFDDELFNETEQTVEQSQPEIKYTVVRKAYNKKRNDVLADEIEVEEIHHYPNNKQCDCCNSNMTELGSKIVREEGEFIPARMKKLVHIEHSYECRSCKKDSNRDTQIKRGKAPALPIKSSIAGPTILAKVIFDKFIQYLPLYRQVKEWDRYGLSTSDKNLSNWVIKASEKWLEPIYDLMRLELQKKNILHVDETYSKVIKRSDGKSGQSNAYNWVYRSLKVEGREIILFQSSLTRSKIVPEEFLNTFSGVLICDGYIVYDSLENTISANCWAHVRRHWLKVDSKLGRIGVKFCDKLYKLENKFRSMSPSKRRKVRNKKSKKIVELFFKWIEKINFSGKNPLSKAATYTLNRKTGLMTFLSDGRIGIDNNPAENAIRPNVIGRKNWMFSVSEAGAKANAVCLSLAETAKANGIDFYKYLEKIFRELPNRNFLQEPEILEEYMPWSKNIRIECSK